MNEFIMMCGVSGSGKSTLAKSLSVEKNAVIVSTDAIRGELFGDEGEQKNGDLVFKIAKKRIKENLDNGRNVIFDATNLSVRGRKDILKSLPNCYKIAICIDISVSRAINNQNLRERKVPVEVIERQHSKFVLPNENEGFDKVKILYK